MADSTGKVTIQVKNEHLATNLKAGFVNALSTAVLSSLMEEASCKAVEIACLISGQTSISAKMKLFYQRPSRLGSNVSVISRIVDIDKDGIHFEIEASDEKGIVGTAKHTRVFVDKDDFEKRCYETARLARQI
ncbi:dihydrolipoamide acyltransferase [Histomonas meleagridis]|uniref:dihydrolipoamide acyltransferase n=1 Tax=Histomonas meleagridis TaxID=135588 RepID=UPI00355AB413|nr:dihydrolipoamide acyltransferase [Histomonas meleagridis]